VAVERKRKINWIGIALAAIIVALIIVVVYLASCTGGDESTTTTTGASQIPPGTEVVRLTEASNGKTITVSPGYLLILELPGYPSQGYQWDILPPDPEVVKGLPGPEITPDVGTTPGTYTFAGIALALGTTSVSGDYVSPTGEVDKTYKLNINVVSSTPTSSTTTSSEATTTTTEAATTTSASTTTSSSTTTTASSTTTSSASTTTTAKPTTTTTAQPTTTTTAKPTTTTTTEKPTTTTTVKLPPTTSTSYIERPPTTEVPGNTYLDERNNGQVVYATVGAQIVLTLGGDASSPYKWSIKKIDTSVLRSTGNPTFTPVAGPKTGQPGVYTFTFDVLKANQSTQLALVYADSSGTVNQYFYVGVVTSPAGVTPF
jgi:predicted secreted protein